MKKPEIRFIIRKYILATSAQDAIKKDKKEKVHDVYVDEDWLKEQDKQNKNFGL